MRSSPKIKRLSRGRSGALSAYLQACGIPEPPPDGEKRALEDRATSTRRALAAAMRRAGLAGDLTAGQADDLERLAGAAGPDALRKAAELAASPAEIPRGRTIPKLLAAALRARNAAAAANMRLAVEYALGVDGRGSGAVSRLDSGDLVQACMAAIVHTAEVYDRWRNGRHSSFANAAGWWLRHFAERALREQGHDFRPPGAALSSRTRVVRALDRIESETGRRPGAAELGAAAGRSARVAAQVLEWAGGGFMFASADAPVRAEPDAAAGCAWIERQAAQDFGSAGGRAVAEAVGAALDALPPEQAAAVRACARDSGDRAIFDGGGLSVREYARRSGLRRAEAQARYDAGMAALKAGLAGLAAGGLGAYASPHDDAHEEPPTP